MDHVGQEQPVVGKVVGVGRVGRDGAFVQRRDHLGRFAHAVVERRECPECFGRLRVGANGAVQHVLGAFDVALAPQELAVPRQRCRRSRPGFDGARVQLERAVGVLCVGGQGQKKGTASEASDGGANHNHNRSESPGAPDSSTGRTFRTVCKKYAWPLNASTDFGLAERARMYASCASSLRPRSSNAPANCAQ